MPTNKPNREPVKVIRKYNDMCRNCQGAGTREGTTCQVCEGHGVVQVTKNILIYVEPVKTMTNDTNLLPENEHPRD